MAGRLIAPQTPSIPFIVSHDTHSIPKISISKPLLNTTPSFSSSSVRSAPIQFPLSKPHPSLLTNCSTTSPDPPAGSAAPQFLPSTIVFVKGLPLSTSERFLKTAFSEFGKVSRVKLVSNKKAKQSLAVAYIWFTSEDSAQAAIEEMNGKFFNGRFISVAIAKFGHCKVTRRATPYKF